MTLPGTTELLVILFLVMLLFGGKKLPGLARGLGDSIRELRKATSDDFAADDHKDTRDHRKDSREA
jgi:sec-independent protein translocase protein TatA